MNRLKILITGANGLVGQYLLKTLHGRDVIVTATGRGPARVPHLLTGGITYEPLDITDAMAVNNLMQSFMPDVIIHSAAMTQADQCELDKIGCWNINVTATRFLADAARSANAFFIYLSTDFVFNGLSGPYREEDIPEPVNYYGSSKLAAERAVMESLQQYAIIRTVLVYGKTADGTRSNIINWVKSSLEKGNRIRVVDDQVRTPTYAGDLAEGIMQVAYNRSQGIWHMAGPDTFTPYQMALSVAKELMLDHELIEKADASSFTQPAQRPLKTGFIIDKARQLLNYQPISFTEGIRKMTTGNEKL